MSLPRYIMLVSDEDTYLKYVKEEGRYHRFLQFSGGVDDLANQVIKFKVEPAKSGEGLVHIKSCYNNKYWRKKSEGEDWVVAEADKPEEDVSKWSCTLFRPKASTNFVCFTHLQRDVPVSYRKGFRVSSCLSLDGEGKLSVRFKDWERLVVLPRVVAFKGDNGEYLKLFGWGSELSTTNDPRLKYEGSDVADQYVGEQIFYNSNGSIKIKNTRSSRHWLVGNESVKLDRTDSSQFWPVKVDGNVIALREARGDGSFFGRKINISNKTLTNSIESVGKKITKEAKIIVEEPVLSRHIHNITFQLSDAGICDEEVVTLATAVASNRLQKPKQIQLNLKHTRSLSSTWSSGISLNLGVPTTMEYSGIPSTTDGKKFEISSISRSSCQWEKSNESSMKIQDMVYVEAEATTKISVRLEATRGTCGIPFSYTQRDVLLNGEAVVTKKDDGYYTGTVYYNLTYIHIHEFLK